MNDNQKNDVNVEKLLKEAYNETQPRDSWEALRVRINHRIDERESPKRLTYKVNKQSLFWRRIALGLAACLILSSGLLVYTIIQFQSGEVPQNPVATEGLFSQTELNQLRSMFINVREVFGQQLPWVVVGAGNEAEIGLEDVVGTGGTSKIVFVRLAVDIDEQDKARRYFDIAAFSGHNASFQFPISELSIVKVSLKPVLEESGAVALEVHATVNGDSEARSTTIVVGDSFTSLVRMRANGQWVNIEGIGQLVSEI